MHTNHKTFSTDTEIQMEFDINEEKQRLAKQVQDLRDKEDVTGWSAHEYQQQWYNLINTIHSTSPMQMKHHHHNMQLMWEETDCLAKEAYEASEQFHDMFGEWI